MITVLRVHGFRVVIYRFDHEPPHVHVLGNGEAKILLVGADGSPEIMFSKAMNRAEQRRALKAVRDAQDELLTYWREIHG